MFTQGIQGTAWRFHALGLTAGSVENSWQPPVEACSSLDEERKVISLDSAGLHQVLHQVYHTNLKSSPVHTSKHEVKDGFC